jgi:hypothetical protein
MWHWFWNPSGHWVIFWGGFGSCLGYVSVLLLGYRKLNCHSKRCFRIGLHHVADTPYIVCKKHHPHVPSHGATAEHINEHHLLAVQNAGNQALHEQLLQLNQRDASTPERQSEVSATG